INAVRSCVHFLYGFDDLAVALRAIARRPIDRVVIARRRDVEDAAHDEDRERVAMLTDPGVLHSDSFAKYAVAFFRISRSSSTRLSWRWSRLFSARSSSSVAFSPQGSGSGANLACQFRRLCSPTPTASAAARKEYPSLTTSRTASFLNSSENWRRFDRPCFFPSFIFRTSFGYHYPVPADIRK